MIFEENRKTALAVGARKIACAGLSGLLAAAPIAVATTALLGTTALTPVYAQDRTTGELAGNVTDQTGAPAAGVVVTLTDATRGFTARAVSGTDGGYRFGRLKIATYTVSVISQGEAIEEVIRVQAGSRQGVNFVVSSTEGLETVTVTARRATSTRKDFLGQEAGITVDTDDLLARVPVGRTATAVALLAPGTAAGDTAFTNSRLAGGGGLPSISGSSVAENTIFINGYNITDTRRFLGAMNFVPFEFFQQIDIKSGGFQSEYGRTTGGVTNLVTRSGTNEFGGGASIFYVPEATRGHSPDTFDIVRSIDTVSSTETNAWLSGPIIEDRLFVYGLVNFRTIKRDNFSNGQLDRSVDDTPRWGVNIDAVLWDDEALGRHTLTYTHINDKKTVFTDQFNFDNTPGEDPADVPIGSLRGTGFQNSGGNTDIYNYKGVIRDWLTVAFLYGTSTSDVSAGSTADSLPVIFDVRSGTFVAIGSWVNFTVTPIDNNQREIFRGDVDIFVDDMFGDHKFRLGFDIENLDSAEESANSGGVYYAYFNEVPERFDPGQVISAANDIVRVRDRTTGGAFVTKHTAIYIQDRWSITDRLTVNLGLRNETFDNKDLNGTTFVKLSNQLDYRLGFTYDISGDQTSRVYGFAGRYHLPVANNTNVRMAGSEVFVHDWFILDSTNADDTPNIGTFLGRDVVSPGGVTPAETLRDKNLKSQKMDEFFLGYEFDMEGDWTFGVRAIYRNLNNAIEDGAIDAGMQTWAADNGLDVAAISTIWSAFHQFILINPGSDATFDAPVSDFTIGPFAPRVDLMEDDMGVIIETQAELDAINAAGLAANTATNDGLAGALAFLGGDPDGDGLVEIFLTAEQIGVPKVKRKYKALELTAEKRFSNGWSLTANYTLSKTSGNYEGSVKSDVGQTDAGLTQDFDTKGLTDGISGLLPTDHRHSFKAFGSYEITDNLVIGANVMVLSPRRFGCLGVHPTDGIAALFGASSFFCDLDGDGVKELTPRGSILKAQWEKRLDLSLTLRPDFEAFEALNVSFRVDVFNVFNSHDWIDLQEFGEFGSGEVRATFGNPTQFSPPRAVRFSARATF